MNALQISEQILAIKSWNPQSGFAILETDYSYQVFASDKILRKFGFVVNFTIKPVLVGKHVILGKSSPESKQLDFVTQVMNQPTFEFTFTKEEIKGLVAKIMNGEKLNPDESYFVEATQRAKKEGFVVRYAQFLEMKKTG